MYKKCKKCKTQTVQKYKNKNSPDQLLDKKAKTQKEQNIQKEQKK